MTRNQRRAVLALQEAEDAGLRLTVSQMADMWGYAGRGYIHALLQGLVRDGWLWQDCQYGPYYVVRRVQPITLYMVWDDEVKALVPFRPS